MKAEERALEKYPADKSVFDKYEKQRYAYICGYIQAEKDLTNKAKVSSGWDGFFYGQGYKQAEKDLELSWKDLAVIDKLGDDFIKHNQMPMSDEEYYQEILKRFKERKEK